MLEFFILRHFKISYHILLREGWSLKSSNSRDIVSEHPKEKTGQGFPFPSENHLEFTLKMAKKVKNISKANNSIFVHRSGAQLLYVPVYVDDIIVTGSASQAIDRFVKKLDEQFSLKDLGKLSYFLGIEVNYTHDGIFLSQRKYIIDLLRKASMDKSNGFHTPMVTTCRLLAHKGSPVEDE
ncbi:hypothetical protein EPI10_020719 [Gossypium australe]|uniref:Reverse transcriptase Ty1/copia-type domain-containing protein n=1 Tax=Gossypium australe TaxID=47621 RepID=A0A5B6WEP0_9ROSI|nr:hypothetical protein EPI10_020719 [Gossypium australe]